MNDTPPEKLLSSFLADSFTTDELRRFLEIFYPDTASKLPNASLSGIAHEAVMALKRGKLIDVMLIRRLEEHLPQRRADIYTCARSWGLKLTFLSGSGPSGFTVNSARIKAVSSPSKASPPPTGIFSREQFTNAPVVCNGSSWASPPREEGHVDADARKKAAVVVFKQGPPSPESCAVLESVYRDHGTLVDLLALYRQCLDDSTADTRRLIYSRIVTVAREIQGQLESVINATEAQFERDHSNVATVERLGALYEASTRLGDGYALDDLFAHWITLVGDDLRSGLVCRRAALRIDRLGDPSGAFDLLAGDVHRVEDAAARRVLEKVWTRFESRLGEAGCGDHESVALLGKLMDIAHRCERPVHPIVDALLTIYTRAAMYAAQRLLDAAPENPAITAEHDRLWTLARDVLERVRVLAPDNEEVIRLIALVSNHGHASLILAFLECRALGARGSADVARTAGELALAGGDVQRARKLARRHLEFGGGARTPTTTPRWPS